MVSDRTSLDIGGWNATSKPTIDQLREQVRAQVLNRGDADYDEARTVHNGMFDKHPGVIVRAEQVANVVAAVNFARETDAELAIKGGGHSAPGFGTTDGGVQLDLTLYAARARRPVRPHRASRRRRHMGRLHGCDARLRPRDTWRTVFTTRLRLAVTLGGGTSDLSRGYGLSIDNLLSVDVVTNS